MYENRAQFQFMSMSNNETVQTAYVGSLGTILILHAMWVGDVHIVQKFWA